MWSRSRRGGAGWLILAAFPWLWVHDARAQDASSNLVGRWRVERSALDLPCRLTALEVRKASVSGDLIAVGLQGDRPGSERTWGSGKLDRPWEAGRPDRWLSAEWTSGPDVVVVQARPIRTADGDRLDVLVRERHRDRTDGERVRQLVMVPETVGERTVSLTRPLFPGGVLPGRPDAAGLFVVHPDGQGLRSVARPDGFVRAGTPAWSPDGKRLAFAAFDSTGRDALIRVVPLDGGPTIAVASGIAPSWSREGDRIAYVASGKSAAATDWNAVGRNDERIELVHLQGPRAGQVEILGNGLWPRFSPKDGRLAWVARRDANWDVYVRSADGLNLIRITDDPALDTFPVWSADATSLMFLSDRLNRWDLWRTSSSARRPPVRLTDQTRREDHPTLSPDGRLVAFNDRRNRPDSSLQILDLDRATVRPLLDPPDADRDPAWSPDGQWIAFASRRPE